MSSTPVEVTFCSRCQKPTFKPRVDLDYSEINTKTPSLSESAFALDHQKVDEMIFLCDRDLEDYEENLMWLRSQILFIEEQQTRLKAHKTRLRSLSHIRKLPTEILASIFGYTCEWNVLQEYPWCIEEEDRPTKLSVQNPPRKSHDRMKGSLRRHTVLLASFM